MKQFAVYTALIGGYDEIHQPLVVDERFDYILFSDEVMSDKVGVWQICKVDYKNADKTRIARYVKTHPEELLPEYKATLWLDSNIQIVAPFVYERVLELYNKGVYVATIKHPSRNCAYDEAFEVSYSNVYGQLEHDITALKWCRIMYENNYPEQNGLCETNILYRLNDKIVGCVDDLWWQCINDFSKRDQLSFNYSLWKNNVEVKYFLPGCEHAKNSSNFSYYGHNKVSKRKQVKQKFWEKLRYRAVNVSGTTINVSRKCWTAFYKGGISERSCLNIFNLTFCVALSPVILFNMIKHRVINR